jgi:hypothetical protein
VRSISPASIPGFPDPKAVFVGAMVFQTLSVGLTYLQVQRLRHAHEDLGMAIWPTHGPGTAMKSSPGETKGLKWIVAKESA